MYSNILHSQLIFSAQVYKDQGRQLEDERRERDS
jgi:hypothetical protein